jgi:hypothetical protein
MNHTRVKLTWNARAACRRIAGSLALAVAAATTMPAAHGEVRSAQIRSSQPPARIADLDQIVLAYEAGDYQVVARRFRTGSDFDGLRTNNPHAFDPLVEAWRKDWRPARPMFFLELATEAWRIGVSPHFVGPVISLTHPVPLNGDCANAAMLFPVGTVSPEGPRRFGRPDAGDRRGDRPVQAGVNAKPSRQRIAPLSFAGLVDRSLLERRDEPLTLFVRESARRFRAFARAIPGTGGRLPTRTPVPPTRNQI